MDSGYNAKGESTSVWRVMVGKVLAAVMSFLYTIDLPSFKTGNIKI